MTRREEIEIAINRHKSHADCLFDYEVGFKNGVEYADKHPKEGIVSLSEVCTWLQNNIDNYATSYGVSSDCLIHALCAAFQK